MGEIRLIYLKKKTPNLYSYMLNCIAQMINSGGTKGKKTFQWNDQYRLGRFPGGSKV